jgi:hypothetical protein
MRIAQIAPLTEAIPPKLYGGTERVISWLADELVALGHDVVLFASGDSPTSANLEASSGWQVAGGGDADGGRREAKDQPPRYPRGNRNGWLAPPLCPVAPASAARAEIGALGRFALLVSKKMPA